MAATLATHNKLQNSSWTRSTTVTVDVDVDGDERTMAKTRTRTRTTLFGKALWH